MWGEHLTWFQIANWQKIAKAHVDAIFSEQKAQTCENA
jgi:hypothetical protein